MKILEFFANMLMVIVLAGTAAGIFVYEGVLESQRECVTIRFRQYERGNPTPNTVYLKKGEEVCLRLTSEDTTHALNIPDMGIYSEPIHPGKWTYVYFTPEESGTFSFVCTIVCSPMHSRVRGKLVIE
ncbi:MAG: cupredoxin domain-containing protein [Chloroflexota bacterium]